MSKLNLPKFRCALTSVMAWSISGSNVIEVIGPTPLFVRSIVSEGLVAFVASTFFSVYSFSSRSNVGAEYLLSSFYTHLH